MSDASRHGELLAELARLMPRQAGTAVRLNIAIAHQLAMPLADVQCLGLLADGPATPGWLAEQLGLTTGAMTKVLDRLQESGYVTRSADPSDRRRIVITPDPTRHSQLAAQFAPMGERMSRQFAARANSELEVILDFIRASERATVEEIDRIRTDGIRHATRPRRNGHATRPRRNGRVEG